MYILKTLDEITKTLLQNGLMLALVPEDTWGKASTDYPVIKIETDIHHYHQNWIIVGLFIATIDWSDSEDLEGVWLDLSVMELLKKPKPSEAWNEFIEQGLKTQAWDTLIGEIFLELPEADLVNKQTDELNHFLSEFMVNKEKFRFISVEPHFNSINYQSIFKIRIENLQ
jgi:hypothetical protein